MIQKKSKRRNPSGKVSLPEYWAASDISDNDLYKGDLARALGSITARSLIMPSTTDLYFTAHDSAVETRQMPHGELRPIISDWGHRAGNPVQSAADQAVLRQAVRDLLAH